ncbi:MAG: hypothetical protein ACRDPY_13250 [Streptosporangiaceae bacterium]
MWLDEWYDELASFPSGDHDDQADTLSYAARVQTAEWTPPTTQPRCLSAPCSILAGTWPIGCTVPR